MKINLLTFHYNANYGAVLQAYALWKKLTNMGHEVEFIDYRPLAATRHYGRQALSFWHGFSYVCSALQRYYRTMGFVARNTRVTRPAVRTRAGMRHRYAKLESDLVIAGGDQIWGFERGGIRTFDPSFFLDFLVSPSVRRASYAASLGEMTTLQPHTAAISSSLAKFSALSVRENAGRKLLQNECGLDAEVVLDPSYLVDLDELSEDTSYEREYVILYLHRPLGALASRILAEFARERRLAIFTTWRQEPIATHQEAGCGPARWLGLIRRARLVITDTYHGALFAERAGRPLVILKNPRKTIKLGELASSLKLEDCALAREQMDREQLERLADTTRRPTDIAPRLEHSLRFLDRLVDTK